jgi:hypothetical protein
MVQSGTAGILDSDHFEGIPGSVRAASIQGCGLECLRCGKMIDHIVSGSRIHAEGACLEERNLNCILCDTICPESLRTGERFSTSLL